MKHVLLAAGLGFWSAAALVVAGDTGPGAQPRQTCDTTYDGLPGGSYSDVDNWTHGLPREGWVACFPDGSGQTAALMNTVAAERMAVSIRPPPLKRWGTQRCPLAYDPV